MNASTNVHDVAKVVISKVKRYNIQESGRVFYSRDIRIECADGSSFTVSAMSDDRESLSIGNASSVNCVAE